MLPVRSILLNIIKLYNNDQDKVNECIQENNILVTIVPLCVNDIYFAIFINTLFYCLFIE